MESSKDSNDAKPTKNEVFRDFLIFWMNHREGEKLFRHDLFLSIVAQVYALPREGLTGVKQVEKVMLSHSLSYFITVLRQCAVHLEGRMAREDLSSVLSYAKEAL